MSGKHPIIQSIEQAQMKQDVPAFGAGDTVVVQVKVKEGDRAYDSSFGRARCQFRVFRRCRIS